MSNDQLKAALEALIAEAKAKGPAKAPDEATRDAVLKAGKRDRYGR